MNCKSLYVLIETSFIPEEKESVITINKILKYICVYIDEHF